jgi:hypothetical protein
VFHAFDGRVQDYEWSPVVSSEPERQAAQPPTVAPIPPPTPTIYWNTPEFDKWIEKTYQTITARRKTPEWQAAEKVRIAEKAARNKSRLERIEEWKRRKTMRAPNAA